MMQIQQYTLDTCHHAEGIVAVIDVCRAFTTAAWAFHRGARRILLTGSVEDAVGLRQRFQGAWIMGEVNGLPVPEFELWNSPHQVSRTDLTGKTMIQRTSSGTQGVLRSTSASVILCTSFAVASASVQWMKRKEPEAVGFVVTGMRNGIGGNEDVACAQYMSALLTGKDPDPEPFLQKVYNCKSSSIRSPKLLEVFQSDLEFCAQLDKFNFAMVVKRQADLLILEPETINE